MDDPPIPTTRLGLFRATLLGDGRLGPIEERIGRRLRRVVDPESAEGRDLLGTCEVDLVGPGGERMGRVQVAEALARLRERLETRLANGAGPEAEVIREGLARIQARFDRVGNA